ncbi:MAG TPA: hypothetical protein VGS28_04755 [Candidatus Saccharimonadales bacterium]|nr:hypothetical protein [Candidatus Saccharimonadales bacterium]
MFSFGRRALQALILTVFVGGSFHLALVFISGIFGGHTDNLDPASFLGLTLISPSLAHSQTLFRFLWVALFGLYFVCLYLLVRWRKYIGIITSSESYNRMQDKLAARKPRKKVGTILYNASLNVDNKNYRPSARRSSLSDEEI